VTVVIVHTVLTPDPDNVDPAGHVYTVMEVEFAGVLEVATSQLLLTSSMPPFGHPGVEPAGTLLEHSPLAALPP
jgi:hypothetical protein